ncbi:MAG: sugar ABC transporter permease, partial [Thermomicrobiaceae bacterium]|nr:sugar ABC transporter permease [Thermomicrobiaceae bacterium]
MAQRRYRFVIPFLAPSLILYAIFVLWPYAQAFYVALTEWRGVSKHKTFVGLKNFDTLVHDPFFWNALKHNGEMLVVLPLVTITLAIFFAALFTQGGRGVAGSGFYRIVFFFPQVMSLAIIGVLWQFIYNPNFGLLNGLFSAIGLPGLRQEWLGSPRLALWCVAAVVIWQAVGFYMVLFIAGMQSIPSSYYEAAWLDGATRWSAFWRITLPLLWDHVQVALVYIGIVAIDLFTIVQVMTEGGPNRASEVVATYMYQTAFQYS